MATRRALLVALTVVALAACSVNSGSGSSGSESEEEDTGQDPGQEASGDEQEDAPDSVLVGVALPYTGAVARTGLLYRKGVELALEEAEASGELGDIEVELDAQDDTNDPSEAVTLVTRFDQDGAVAMFGAHSSPVALAQAEAVEGAELPEFVFGASNAIDSPYQYQVNARDSEQITNVINFAEQNGFTSVGLLTDTGAYGTSALEQLDTILGESDLEIVGSETFEPAASNITPQLVSLRDAAPDFIAMFSFGTPYAAVVQGKAEIGWDVPVIGNVAAGDVAIGEIAGEDADGLYYMTPLGTESEASQQLADAWAEAYPDDPLTFEGAIGYDSMRVLVRALTEGGTTREAVQEWLSAADAIDGLATGQSPWDLTERRPVEAEDLSFRVWESGETVPFEPAG